MENVSGEEIERALMDLGPLLGVTIKEEVPDELPDPTATPGTRQNAGLHEGASASGSSTTEPVKDTEGADSLASPGATNRNSILLTRCVYCQNLLSQCEGTPKLIACLHSACEPCVKQKIEEKLALRRDYISNNDKNDPVTITCPVCQLDSDPHHIIDQRFLIEKLALEQAGNSAPVSGDQQCNSCEDTEPATSYCVDCAEFICDNCVHAHQRLKITKDHTIKSKEEAVAELQATQLASSVDEMHCADHPQERLSLFCESCERLTCRDCQLQLHRAHKYQFTTEMAVQARKSMSSLRSEVRYKRQLLGSAMKVIHERQQAIGDKKKSLVHDITTTVVKLTNAINSRGKQLVLRLNEVCDAKQRTLSEKKDALEQLAVMTDHCLDFVHTTLEQGSDTAVLYAKKAVCNHLQVVKSSRADIPNPDIPVRISLALDKLPELLKVLSNMGAIVVDGRVDGQAGGAGPAQGPYHPPSPAPTSAPASAPAPPHSAVVALQHVAMQQSYVQSRSGGASPVGGVAGVTGAGYMQLQQQMRARAHTPLRHAHVTSTTHPHHLHGMSELNLRGLLNAGGQRARAAPPHPHPHAQQAMHHAYQQMMAGYAAGNANVFQGMGVVGAGGGGGRARGAGGPRAPSPAPHYPPPAKWHIPQQQVHNGGFEMSAGHSTSSGGGTDFKITLVRPPAPRAAPAPAPAPAVTSTNPKTPSPSLNGSVSSDLDKVCAESVQDLMATIAKLDSNGVQVLPEHTAAPPTSAAASPAPHVHSSTDGAASGSAGGSTSGAAPTGDPNEDWCAVCMDGGELMCCDKCPKVFHQYCHIPTIEKLPDESETWQCLLCVNFAELHPEEAMAGGDGLTLRQQKLVERITLELYCQYEPSLPFREPVPQDNLLYHSKIQRPMCLDMIRMKLQPTSSLRYMHIAQFVADCRLLFRNAYHYNTPDSQIFKDAKRLEEFFDAQLLKWLPEYAYWSGEGEPPAKRSRSD